VSTMPRMLSSTMSAAPHRSVRFGLELDEQDYRDLRVELNTVDDAERSAELTSIGLRVF
jgi:hypothetical protein